MNEKERKTYSLENQLDNKHSLVCNDELFVKDLIAIVDDTMRVEEDENQH